MISIPRVSSRSDFILGAVLLFGACTDPGAEPASQSASLDPGIESLEPARRQALGQFFDDEQILAILKYEAAFESVSTAEQFAEMFDEAVALGQTVLVAPDSIDEMLFFEAFAGNESVNIEGLDAACVAECTVPSFAMDSEGMASAASRTDPEVDDEFVSLVSDYYGGVTFIDGQLNGYGSYFLQTWDYGGYSLLGSGDHQSLLERVVDLEQKTDLFVTYLAQMRRALLEDAAGWNSCFGLGEEAVIAELSSLRIMSALTDAERSLVDARLTQLAETEEIETGCEDVSCTCGSG